VPTQKTAETHGWRGFQRFHIAISILRNPTQGKDDTIAVLTIIELLSEVATAQ
jgi:hypothetical protein